MITEIWFHVLAVPAALIAGVSKGGFGGGLVVLALAPAGIWLGLWMRKRVPGRAFYGVCSALLFVTGLKLADDGVAGLLRGRKPAVGNPRPITYNR